MFVNQDMTHVTKRCVNTLELSNPGSGKSRSLKKHHEGVLEELCLDMTMRARECLGGGDPACIRDSDTRRLSRQHFEKDCFSRMRVPLAFQVVSASAARLLRRAAAGDHGYGKSALPEGARKFTCLIELCEKLNRVVDIMNARSEMKAPILSSPQHELISESLGILGWFAEWHADLGRSGEDMDTAFFPQALWEDINGLLLGVACTARFCLAAFPGEQLLQRRLDQDPCEHHFNHVRGNAGSTRSPDLRQCTQSTSTAGDMHAGGLTGGLTGNSGQKSTEASFLSPLPRKPDSRKSPH